jgi:serine/threonine-protein kinase HipA
MADIYKPRDEMSLWWLGESMPVRVGRLVLADNHRKVGLEYGAAWLARGFPLSDDLPLARGLHLPTERDAAAGAVDDARPDRWGERIIRQIYKPPRLSLLEYLYFAGDNRFGALGVALDDDHYHPSGDGAIASFDNLADMERAIAAVLAGENLSEEYVRLLRPGPSFGGARPKSLISIDGAQWVLKFSEGEAIDTQLIEHASMTLASRCGIDAAASKALPLSKGHAVAIRRFDRSGAARKHVISAHTVLRAAGLPLGYPELAQLMRRMGRPDSIRAQQQELFRRMVFNILLDNTDDHEKNHAFIRAQDGHYELSPAFDLLPAAQGLGYQQMRVGSRGTESSLDNALSEVAAFGLKRDQAIDIVRGVCEFVNGWKEHFLGCGVVPRDIDELAQTIDGEALSSQRAEYLRPVVHPAGKPR